MSCYSFKVNVRPSDEEMAFVPYRPIKKRRLIGRCSDKPLQLYLRPKTESNNNNKMTGHISIHHFNEGAGRRMIGQKTFVSTCQFQPKRVPVKYSETLVLHLNSTKRKYYESISYETKMVPSQWSQTMYLDIVTGEDRIVNEIHIPCENYVSLIPQQVIAQISEHESQLKDSNNQKQLNGSNIKSEEIDETKEIKNETEKEIKNIPVQNKHHRAGRNEFNDIYCKNTCEEFLNELRKVKGWAHRKSYHKKANFINNFIISHN